MRRNMNLWKQEILASKKRLVIPVITHPGIAMNNQTVLETVRSARLHASAVQTVARHYPTSASTLIMDLSVEAETFGAKVRFSEDEVPSVVGRIVSDGESIDQLKIPALSEGRVGQWIEASRIVSQTLTDRPLRACCIGPFSLAARLFDVTEILTAILIDPEPIHRLLEKCVRFLTSYVQAFKEAGANGVFMAEPVAGVLSSDLCTEFSSNYVKRIVEAAQDEYFIVMLHNCGDTDTLVESMVATGAAALHFGNRCNIVEALPKIPADTLVLGNIDPVGVLKSGDAEVVSSATLRLLLDTKEFPNYVLSSGCDIPPRVPIENIDAFFRALNDFNKR